MCLNVTTSTTATATTITKPTTTTVVAAATKARTKTKTIKTKCNNKNYLMRDFLLQFFILTTFVSCPPFSVYPILIKAMPHTEQRTATAAETTTKADNPTATGTGTASELILAATIATQNAKFPTATPSFLLPTLELDSNEIDNSYFSDYIIANQVASTAIATAAATATSAMKSSAITATTTITTATSATTGSTATATATAAEATVAAATVAAAAAQKQHANANTQDLLSLSLLSLNETTAKERAAAQKSASSHRNIIGGDASGSNVGVGSNGAAAIATTFQEIGAQKIAFEPTNNASSTAAAVDGGGGATATDADSSSHSRGHTHSRAHTHSASGSGSSSYRQTATVIASATIATGAYNAGSNKSTIRASAKKGESKYILPKPQKTDAPMLNYIFDAYSTANKHHHHDQRYGPHFEDVEGVGQPTNMTVQAGSSIHLNCRISLLHDKTVSWVRRNAQSERNALDLLTVGFVTYTGDKRYKIEFQYPNNWRLKITNVKKDDEAMYECQISTYPPRVIQINLHVNAPKVMIVDEYGDPLQEKYYETDSTLQLSCVVRNVEMTTSVVYWQHAENMLNYDVTRGGVSVKTELMDDGANSTLYIAKINKTDSGNYTCAISEFQNFTIVVHILNGESFAELHHGDAASTHAALSHTVACIIIVMLCCHFYSSAHIVHR